MKELTLGKKTKVIKLFLSGYTYDEIAQQVGIAKGSVVNIVDEFRNGNLPLPPGMTEYVDELRHIAVDLKKQHTTIVQVKSCLKLHAKLQDMGVDSEQGEQWLDICQDIASPTASNSQFVKAALELAQVTSGSGLSYGSLMQDYNAKLELSKALDAEIEQKKGQFGKLKLEWKEQREQATNELNILTKALATAQDTFQKQKQVLKSHLDEYLAQNKLSWEKVNAAVALLSVELGKKGLSQEGIGHLSKQIASAGSLFVAVKQLEEERDTLQSKVNQLARERDDYASSVSNLEHVNQKLCNSIFEKAYERDQLNTEIESKKSCLEQMNQTIALNIHDIYIANLVIGLLIFPDNLPDDTFDLLFRLMIAVRQLRLGKVVEEFTDNKGNSVCLCPVPKIMTNLATYNVDFSQVKDILASYLMPIVKDRFVARQKYEMAEADHQLDLLEAQQSAQIAVYKDMGLL